MKKLLVLLVLMTSSGFAFELADLERAICVAACTKEYKNCCNVCLEFHPTDICFSTCEGERQQCDTVRCDYHLGSYGGTV